MINSAQKDRVVAVLTKYGLKEQAMAKNLFIKDDGSNIAADLRGKEPEIGIFIGDKVQTSGHGVSRVQDIVNEVAAVMKKSQSPVTEQLSGSGEFGKPKGDEPSKRPDKHDDTCKGSNPASGGISKAPELKKDDVMKGAIPSEPKLGAGDTHISKTTAICKDCGTAFETTLDNASQLMAQFSELYCLKCRGKHEAKTPEASKDQKVAGNVPATPKPGIIGKKAKENQ